MAQRLLAAAILAAIGLFGTVHGSMAAGHTAQSGHASGAGVIWGTHPVGGNGVVWGTQPISSNGIIWGDEP